MKTAIFTDSSSADDSIGFGGLVGLASDISGALDLAAEATAEGMASEWPETIEKECWATGFLEGKRLRHKGSSSFAEAELLAQFLGSRMGCIMLLGCIYLLYGACGYIASCTSGNSGSQSAPVSTHTTQPTAEPSALPAAASAADFPDYSVVTPPEGDGFELSVREVRYCVFEDVRLSKMKSLTTNNRQVAKFNRYVDDYNKRCSHFRYVPGVLERCRRQAAEIDEQLANEARVRMKTDAKKKK